MNPYEMFKTNKRAEKQGVEIDYGDFIITVARAGGSNKKYGAVLKAKMTPYRKALDKGVLDEAIAEKVMNEVYALSIIVGWHSKIDTGEVSEETGEAVYKWEEGIVGSTGDLLEFSPKNVQNALNDLPELAADIREQATSLNLFRELEVEEAGKV